jgi:hypothetical protein
MNTGTEPAAGLTLGLLSLLLASAGVWASLVALVGSPEERTFSRAGRRLRSPGSRFGAVSSVALKRMGRNRLVRRHVLFVAAVAGTLSCLTSILLPGVARVATGGLVLLAAFSVAVVPLATYGTGRDSSWLWRSAPVPLAVYAPGMVVAGFCGGILALAVPAATATLPAFRAGGDSPALGTLAVVAAVTLLLATGTGFSCPAPWRTPPSRSSPTPCSALRSPASSPPPRGPRPGLRSSVSRSWRSKPGSCSPPPASRSPWLRDGAREEEGVIFEIEVPVFPPGVQLRRSHILDTVTGDRVPIKETARLMLSLVDGRRTAKEIGEAVAASYGLALAG